MLTTPKGKLLLMQRGIILRDTFSRADNTASLGVTDTGQAWVASQGTWGVTGEVAYTVTGNTADLVLVDVGKLAFSYECLMMTPDKAQYAPNLVFRGVDSTNWLRIAISNNIILTKSDGGVLTQLGTASISVTNSQYHRVKATFNGSTISCFFDDTAMIVYTMTAEETTKYGASNATKVGLRASQNSFSGCGWNNLLVTT